MLSVVLPLLLAAIGCGPKPSADAPAASPSGVSITDRDWVLVSLGERSSPIGAKDQPITLRFEASTSRAVGFAGCNRFNSTYTLTANTVSFGPVAATRMSCGDADEIERSFLATLSTIKTYEATGSTLTLNGPEGPLARFEVR